jgi:four helix bundle protein
MTQPFRSYRDLQVWQKSMVLARDVYDLTKRFPSEEKFGLASQMRRCAVSIPSNIAEGHARQGTAEFQHSVSIAMGSVAELETQVILSADLGYTEESPRDHLLTELDTLGRMLRGLLASLARKRSDASKTDGEPEQ